MPDCKDIDARIVDVLYGELDSSDEASFREHIDSCEACTGQLASFAWIRDAMARLPEEEPPIAVSNILLHEAGKHATAQAKQGAQADEARGPLAWLTRLFQPLIAHPAMAAVASLVLVATVGGTMYLKSGKQVAEPVIPAQPEAQVARAGERRATADETALPPSPTGHATPGTGSVEGLIANGDKPAPPPPAKESNDGLRKASSAETAEFFNVDTVSDGELGDLKKAEEANRERNARVPTANEMRAGAVLEKKRDERKPSAMPKGGTWSNAVSGADSLLDSTGKDSDDSNVVARLQAKQGNIGRAADDADFGEPVSASSDDAAAKSIEVMEPESLAPSIATGRSLITVDSSALPGQVAPPDTSAGPARRVAKKAKKKSTRSKRSPSPSPKADKAPVAPVRSTSSSRSASGGGSKTNWSESQHSQLLAALDKKRCDVAARLANDIRDRDPRYYNRNLRSSKKMAPCQTKIAAETSRRSRRKRAAAKAKAEAVEKPAEADRAAAEAVE